MTPQEIIDKIHYMEVPYDVYLDINIFLEDNKENDALNYIQNYFKCTEDIAKETLILYKETLYANHQRIMEDSETSLTAEQIAYVNAQAWGPQNKPKCPICQSTNLKMISFLEKLVLSETYQCLNCFFRF